MDSALSAVPAKARISGSHDRLVHLDMLRGLAALGVVIGHARGFVVVSYATSPSDTLGAYLFYFATGLGHQCVLAFFALSGFLVGGQALGAILAGEWNWPRYLLRRLNRLWIVLLPALFLTWILDVAGQRLAGSAGYNGAYFGLIASGPRVDAPADLSFTTLLANAAFMQTIIAPVFGSNGPLWSLANEFWYYVIFPFIAQGLFGRGQATTRVLCGFIGFAIATFIPVEMLLLGGVWVAGAVAGYLTKPLSGYIVARLWLAPSLVSLAVILVLVKLKPGLFSDIVLGFACAAVLPVFALLPKTESFYDRLGGGLAAISYTLYATHFPLLAFIWFVWLAPHKWPLGVNAAALMIAFVGVALAVATAMWWLFERNTDRLRAVWESWLSLAVPRHAKT